MSRNESTLLKLLFGLAIIVLIIAIGAVLVSPPVSTAPSIASVDNDLAATFGTAFFVAGAIGAVVLVVFIYMLLKHGGSGR